MRESTAVKVRDASIDDSSIILQFVLELARYERAEHEVIATLADVEDSIFGESAVASSLIAEHNGEAIGFAVYFYNYSTWLGRKGIYLEDLYVTPESRGLGAGKLLLRELARRAVDEGCGRLDWSVLDWNEPAIGFYKSIGAVGLDEWTGYRLTGDALASFAADKP